MKKKKEKRLQFVSRGRELHTRATNREMIPRCLLSYRGNNPPRLQVCVSQNTHAHVCPERLESAAREKSPAPPHPRLYRSGFSHSSRKELVGVIGREQLLLDIPLHTYLYIQQPLETAEKYSRARSWH